MRNLNLSISLLISFIFFQQKVFSQVITTISGNYYAGEGYSGDGGPATNAQLHTLAGLAVDAAGNLYLCDNFNNRIRKVDAVTNIISTYAGNGVSGYTGDNGLATAAEISFPEALAIDKSGNLYIADHNNCIRRIDAATQVITTVAGNGVSGFSGDGGLATSAELSAPMGIALDKSGNLFISDNNNSRIRKVDAVSGLISTYAGNGVNGYSGDGGSALSAKINTPRGLAVDVNGNLFIAENTNNCIRRVDNISGQITTFVGNGTAGSSGDGSAVSLALLNTPSGVFIDASGNFYISDLSERIRFINASTGIISTIAGNGTVGSSGNGGPATLASLNNPGSPLLDANGNIYFSDIFNGRVRKIDAATGFISNYAGNFVPFAGDGGPSVSAVYRDPMDIEFDNAGNLFILDLLNIRVRKIDAATKIITTIAGDGSSGFAGDGGPASEAKMFIPQDLAVDIAGNIYVADCDNSRIRKIDAVTNIITTVAGNGVFGSGGRGGLAIDAELPGPQGIAFDKFGNLYIVNWFGSTVDRVDAATHIITTIAGQSYNWGYTGDGGLATNARLYFPYSVDVDDQGNVYVADNGNSAVRKIDGTTHIISTITGNGTPGSLGDGGPASAATVSYPWKVKMDKQNNLYISEGNRVRKIDLGTQIITGVAGSGASGYAGDGGPPLKAELSSPVGVAFDASDNTYIADYANNVIREIVSSPLPTKLLSFQGHLTGNNETLLKWTTALEQGTAYFDIQYSADGKQFSSVSSVYAKGESSSYSYTHCCPAPGNNYYRLKMIDQDGKFSFSEIISVKMEEGKSELSIFPNPSSDVFVIRFPASKKEEAIRIMNSNGTVVKVYDIPEGSSEKSISLKGMAAGIYLAQFTNSELGTSELILR